MEAVARRHSTDASWRSAIYVFIGTALDVAYRLSRPKSWSIWHLRPSLLIILKISVWAAADHQPLIPMIQSWRFLLFESLWSWYFIYCVKMTTSRGVQLSRRASSRASNKRLIKILCVRVALTHVRTIMVGGADVCVVPYVGCRRGQSRLIRLSRYIYTVLSYSFHAMMMMMMIYIYT